MLRIERRNPYRASWTGEDAFALALSHDVDRVHKRWQFPYNAVQALCSCQLERLGPEFQSLWALLRGDDPYWNFGRIIAVESDLGVRSTFFFMSEGGRPSLFRPQSMVLYCGRYSLDDERIQQVIRELDAGGWEIGLHGSYRSYQSGALLRREKEQLEAVLGKPVRGVRQHYLNLEIPETWVLQARAGLVYDSTLGSSDDIGFSGGTSGPFFPRDPLTGSRIELLQIPLGIMDVPLMRMDRPWAAFLSLVDQVERERGVLTLNWHQRVFGDWEYQAYRDMYQRIILECQRRGAKVTTLGEVAQACLDAESQA